MIRPEWLRKMIGMFLCGLGVGMVIFGFWFVAADLWVVSATLLIFGVSIFVMTMIELLAEVAG